MPIRVYPVALNAWNRDELGAQLSTALGLSGVTCFGNAQEVSVEHPNLNAGHDSTVNATLASYTMAPIYVPASVTLATRTDAIAIVNGRDRIGVSDRGLILALLDEINILRAAIPRPVNVSGITRSGTVMTVTLAVNHGLAVNDNVAIFNAVQLQYNGVKTVATVPSATTFTVSGITGNPTTPATGSIIAMIQPLSLPPRTIQQAITAITNAINAGSVDT